MQIRGVEGKRPEERWGKVWRGTDMLASGFALVSCAAACRVNRGRTNRSSRQRREAKKRERPAITGAGVRVDGRDDEGAAEDAGREGLADGYGGGAFDWADRCAGAREDGFDLRDGPAHLWVGPMVAGAHQAAGDAGARILRRGRARGRRGARG